MKQISLYFHSLKKSEIYFIDYYVDVLMNKLCGIKVLRYMYMYTDNKRTNKECAYFFSVLAVAIFSFRKTNLMKVQSYNAAEVWF